MALREESLAQGHRACVISARRHLFLCSTISSGEKVYALALMGQDIIEITYNY